MQHDVFDLAPFPRTWPPPLTTGKATPDRNLEAWRGGVSRWIVGRFFHRRTLNGAFWPLFWKRECSFDHFWKNENQVYITFEKSKLKFSTVVDKSVYCFLLRAIVGRNKFPEEKLRESLLIGFMNTRIIVSSEFQKLGLLCHRIFKVLGLSCFALWDSLLFGFMNTRIRGSSDFQKLGLLLFRFHEYTNQGVVGFSKARIIVFCSVRFIA